MRLVVALTALSLCAALPAHADTGVNTGDAGVLRVEDGPLAGQCAFEQVNVPNTGTAVLLVGGQATASPRGAVRAVSTSLRCQVRDVYSPYGVAFDETVATEGAATATAGAPVTGSSSWVVCTEITALYADAEVVTTGQHCLAPA